MRDRTLDIEVVFVCDGEDSDDDDASDAFSTDSDRPSVESLRLIQAGLMAIARHVVHYANLRDFADNLHHHREAIVFPYWFGILSRSRHSLVPAICEAYGIVYVGADAYTKAVCNDKFLSKSLCALAGLTAAPSFLLTCDEDFDLLTQCSYPRVVKPNFQGSSLGIDDKSLVATPDEARAAAERTARYFGWPVLCEEFIAGREISVCLMGNHQTPPALRSLSWELNGDPAFLDNRLFSYALKTTAGTQFRPIIVGDLAEVQRQACNRLFALLDKAEILRVDGRMTAKGFVVLELSPDLDLRPDGEAAVAFSDCFASYPLFLRQLLLNALERAGREPPVHDEG